MLISTAVFTSICSLIIHVRNTVCLKCYDCNAVYYRDPLTKMPCGDISQHRAVTCDASVLYCYSDAYWTDAPIPANTKKPSPESPSNWLVRGKFKGERGGGRPGRQFLMSEHWVAERSRRRTKARPPWRRGWIRPSLYDLYFQSARVQALLACMVRTGSVSHNQVQEIKGYRFYGMKDRISGVAHFTYYLLILQRK